ncbi:MAG: hypothetical protein KME16_00100 [Scytolyngbya sp. HA4215-MV1]|nr:hypothetical protein [Scytolyngbya sp. HA4215-MV1]
MVVATAAKISSVASSTPRGNLRQVLWLTAWIDGAIGFKLVLFQENILRKLLAELLYVDRPKRS